MVVEDDRDTREILCRQLRKDNWQVVAAENGRQALRALDLYSPELIVSDLMMPEMDGFELVHELRQNEKWRAIPVVVLTAKELTAADRQKLNGRVVKIFEKGSYQRQVLLQEVSDLLSAAISRKHNHIINAQVLSV